MQREQIKTAVLDVHASREVVQELIREDDMFDMLHLEKVLQDDEKRFMAKGETDVAFNTYLEILKKDNHSQINIAVFALGRYGTRDPPKLEYYRNNKVAILRDFFNRRKQPIKSDEIEGEYPIWLVQKASDDLMGFVKQSHTMSRMEKVRIGIYAAVVAATGAYGLIANSYTGFLATAITAAVFFGTELSLRIANKK